VYFHQASAGRRNLARAYGMLVVVAEIAASLLPIADAGFASPGQALAPYVVAVAILLLFCAFNCLAAYRTGTLPGLKSFGVKAVLVEDVDGVVAARRRGEDHAGDLLSAELQQSAQSVAGAGHGFRGAFALVPPMIALLVLVGRRQVGRVPQGRAVRGDGRGQRGGRPGTGAPGRRGGALRLVCGG